MESVLAQTFHDFEVIVSDNASTDSTEIIVERYAMKDSRVKLFRNPMNLGCYQNYNRCLEYAEGEYISMFGSDDIMLPNNLELKVAVLDEYPSVGLIASSVNIIDSDGNSLDWGKCHQYNRDILIKGREWILQEAGKRTTVCHSSVILRSEVLIKLDKFIDCDYPYIGDFDLWLRIALISDIFLQKQSLVQYRYKYQDHAGTHGFNALQITQEIIQMWSKIITHLDLPASELTEVESKRLVRISEWCADLGLNITVRRNMQSLKLMRRLNQILFGKLYTSISK